VHRDILRNRVLAANCEGIWDRLHRGEISCWDYKWLFALVQNEAMVVSPSVNLVSNIGFGADSTHTTDESHFLARRDTGAMIFPLSHPPFKRDKAYERAVTRSWFPEEQCVYRLWRIYYRAVSFVRRLTGRDKRAVGEESV